MIKSVAALAATASLFVAAPLWASHPPEPALLMQFIALVPETEARAAGIVGEHSRRFSRVSLNLDTLRTEVNHLGSLGRRNEGGARSPAPTVGQVVEIEPFPNERYRLRGRLVEATDDGPWTWVGEIVGKEHSDAVLTIDGENIYGTLRVDEVIHEFRTGSNGITYAREPDPDGYGFESHCAVGRQRPVPAKMSSKNPRRVSQPPDNQLWGSRRRIQHHRCHGSLLTGSGFAL